jgi:mono/diheme cytochrome c family protein
MSRIPVPSPPPATGVRRSARTCTALLMFAAAMITAASTATAAESTAGAEQLYREHCANCHSLNLRGSAHGSTLAGDTFLSKWRDQDAMSLLAYLRTNMPPGNPGILSEAQQADIAAYIIASNQDPSAA